jgi:hypothetical protein
LSESAFLRLLNWLDEGADSSGARYVEIRRRLAEYFDRKDCAPADDLADETLNRVARRLEEEGSITGPAPLRYCYTVAKFVFLESLHEAKRDPVSLEALSAHGRTEALTARGKSKSELTQIEEDEERYECLQRCLRVIEQRDRDLICEYYYGEQRAKIENRHRLAARLGLSANALSIRACRIRRDLAACVRRCMESVKGRHVALGTVE